MKAHNRNQFLELSRKAESLIIGIKSIEKILDSIDESNDKKDTHVQVNIEVTDEKGNVLKYFSMYKEKKRYNKTVVIS